jgi:hypothetical protein
MNLAIPEVKPAVPMEAKLNEGPGLKQKPPDPVPPSQPFRIGIPIAQLKA